jgi:hypothetical protein
MSHSKWKLEILTRRATYCAAALATAGAVGCDKADKPASMCLSVAPTEQGDVDVLPMLCLSGSIGPASSKSPPTLDRPYPFVVKATGVDLEGTILAKVDGPTVPHAAHVATGAHMRVRARTCFIEAVRKGTKVEGTVDVTLEVGADGSVTKATTSGTLDQALRDCIAEGAKKVGFNPVEGGAASKVIVQMSFPKKG